MTTRHYSSTRMYLKSNKYGELLDLIDIESDLTTSASRREVHVAFSSINSSAAVVLTREQVCKFMDLLTFHLEATAHIDHRSEDGTY